MFKNYIKIAFRNIIKNKVYSFINITGLAIGIAGSLLILVYVAGQLSYESMHENRDRIVRVSVQFGKDDASMTLAGAMPALGPAAAANIPDVKSAVRFRADQDAKIKIGDKIFTEHNFFFADSNVFNVFTFPLIEGNKETALNNPTSIVISKSTAEKYFGDVDAVGKTLTYNGKYNFIVSGVMMDVPENTMLKCDLIAPISRAFQIQKAELPWNSFGDTYTYLYLNKNMSLDDLSSKLHGLLQKNTNEAFASMIKFKVLPLKNIYFESNMMGELGPTGDITTVYLLSSIAFLVLLIACLNFINLSTARSIKRAKEVGLRKVLGADRRRLIAQFYGESLIVTLAAIIISVLIFELTNPMLNNYLGVKFSGSSFNSPYFFLILTGLLIFVSTFAGIYPAVFLSRFKPVDSLKSGKTPGSSSSLLRKILVVSQFAITIFLIIGTAAIYKQINFMRNSDLGFNKKDVVVLKYPVSKDGMKDKYTVLKDAFKSIPGITDVSGSYTLPGINSKETESVRLKGKPAKDFAMFQAVGVDYNFIPTLGLKLTKGRNFEEKYSTDKSDAIIMNQAAVKYLGLENPIGTEVMLPAGNGKERAAKIIGVIKDFHVTSFRKNIEPMFLYINPNYYYNIALKIDPKYKDTIISSLKQEWNKVLPGVQFDYSFLSQTYNSLYESDEKTGNLFSIFSFLSILIACMGLFGLVSYSIEVRTKEIGIRKVLGADVKSISTLMSKDFIKWTLIANIFAWPLAYLAVSKWLDGFAYKTSIGFSIFIAAAVIVLLIALITVSIQAIRAASANPVKAIRYE